MKQPVQFRSTAAAKAEQKCPQIPTTVTFAKDILPLFQPFQKQMTWRFDLTRYDVVRDNASLIFDMISTHQMPPKNAGGPFKPEQIAMFRTWMYEGFPP
jgi:hypothetical protein